jgi:hypothetical protein
VFLLHWQAYSVTKTKRQDVDLETYDSYSAYSLAELIIL